MAGLPANCYTLLYFYFLQLNIVFVGRAMAGNKTIGENYSFSGVHHIFDQHKAAGLIINIVVVVIETTVHSLIITAVTSVSTAYMHTRHVESLLFCGTPTSGLENLGLQTVTPALKNVDSDSHSMTYSVT